MILRAKSQKKAGVAAGRTWSGSEKIRYASEPLAVSRFALEASSLRACQFVARLCQRLSEVVAHQLREYAADLHASPAI